MLLAITMVAKSAQYCPKLPKFAKIFPKTISSRNFEIPPKIEILIFFPKKKMLYVEEAPKHVHIVWIFNTIIFVCLFIVKKLPLYVNSAYPLVEFYFFSMFHTSSGYEIL
jgi:hypothetical protein